MTSTTMAKQTDFPDIMSSPLMKVPTLEECRLQASKIALPESEADKFWYYYDAKGWKVGKTPMRHWRSAMSHWKIVWQERRGQKQCSTDDKPTLSTREVLTRFYDRLNGRPRP